MKEFIDDLKLGTGMFEFRGGNTDFAFTMNVVMDFFRAQVSLWGCNFPSYKNPFLLCTWLFPAGDEQLIFQCPRTQSKIKPSFYIVPSTEWKHKCILWY